MKKNKKEELKVTYHYVEPKTKEEKEEWERRVSKAFEILFEATSRDSNKH